ERFTASDVKFTYETLLRPSSGSPYTASYSDIDRIEVIDDHTISFTYSRPYSPALSKFGMGIVPRHLLKDVSNIRKSGFARAPVGTGPYTFSSWESGQFIILNAFPEYFRDGPHIERYVYKIIPDSAVQYLELISGGIDSMNLDPYQYIYRSDEKVFTSRMDKYRYLSRSYTYIGYNLNDPVLSDRDVRAALSYAVNKRKLIDSVLLGLGEKCTGPFFKRSPFYNDDVTGYPYNPDKARELLKKAGWVDTDNDGILEKNGEEFRIGLSTNQGNRTRKDTATIIQSHWAEIGVKADIHVVSWSAFLDQFVNKKNFQAVILGWTLPLDPDPYNVWHSRAAGPGGLNFVSFRDGELDRLIEEGRKEFDTSERARIYRKAHRIISEAAPYTFLFFPYALPAVHKRFRGIEPAPAGIGYNFTEWYVPEDEVIYDFRRR
ncbi:MAG: peptide-binding protein, partial [Candidatus Omnitrophica bacterium]|nr:peptide-binding protein [Candidatus Omnitrophota bacterium]